MISVVQSWGRKKQEGNGRADGSCDKRGDGWRRSWYPLASTFEGGSNDEQYSPGDRKTNVGRLQKGNERSPVVFHQSSR